MGNETPFLVNDSTGDYSLERPATPSEIVEQAKRLLAAQFQPGEVIKEPGEAANYFITQFIDYDREVFAVLFLDNRHQILKFEKMFFGTINGAQVHPREVVKRALALNSAAVLLTHNHPSTVAEPSAEDEAITRRIKAALDLVDIRLLDHIIVGGSTSVSMASRGLV